MSKKSGSIGRRRSRSLAGIASKDLCERIPLSLPPSERLKKICELSFEFALSEVQKKFAHRQDLDVSTFQEKATEGLENAKVLIEEENLFNLAVTENVPPDESLVNENVGACNEAIAKLQAEDDKWKDHVLHLRNSLTNKINSSYTINASEWEDSDQLYDYSNVLKYASSVQDQIFEQVGTLSSVNAVLSDSLQTNETLYRSIKEKVEKDFTHTVPDTPRTIIKNMVGTRVMKP